MPLLGGLRAACGRFSAEMSMCSGQAVFCQKTAGRLRRQLMPVSHGEQSAGGAAAPGWGQDGARERKEEGVGESSCQKRTDPGKKEE